MVNKYAAGMAEFSVSGCALRALATGCSQDRLNNLAHERLAPIQGVSVMPSSNTLIVTPQSSDLTPSRNYMDHIHIPRPLLEAADLEDSRMGRLLLLSIRAGRCARIASSRPRSQYNRVKPAVRAEIVPGRDRRNPSMELRLTDMNNAFVRSNHLRTFL